MPWCFGASQSVRARSIPRSAWWALVFHTFWPLTTHSSPSSTAVVVSPARSEPADGSLNSWHHTSSPVSSGRRKRSRARSGPCSRIVGPARPAGHGRHRATRAGSRGARRRRPTAGRPSPVPPLRPRRHRPPGVDEPLPPRPQRQRSVPVRGDPGPHLGAERCLGDASSVIAGEARRRGARRRRRPLAEVVGLLEALLLGALVGHGGSDLARRASRAWSARIERTASGAAAAISAARATARPRSSSPVTRWSHSPIWCAVAPSMRRPV